MASESHRGMSSGSVLGLIFIVLKLTGNINWSWFWVLSPWIFGLAICALMIFGYGGYALTKAISDCRARRRRMDAMLDEQRERDAKP